MDIGTGPAVHPDECPGTFRVGRNPVYRSVERKRKLAHRPVVADVKHLARQPFPDRDVKPIRRGRHQVDQAVGPCRDHHLRLGQRTSDRDHEHLEGRCVLVAHEEDGFAVGRPAGDPVGHGDERPPRTDSARRSAHDGGSLAPPQVNFVLNSVDPGQQHGIAARDGRDDCELVLVGDRSLAGARAGDAYAIPLQVPIIGRDVLVFVGWLSARPKQLEPGEEHP